MIQDDVKEIIESEIADFQPGRALYSQLNSIEIVGLVDRLERRFGIAIEPIEVDEENFASLESVVKLITEKCKSG